MPTQARAGVIRHKAKGFGGSRVYHFMNINAHFICHDFHFIHQANIHGAMDVF